MIQLGDDPREYGLPFSSWRPRQKEICEKAINLAPGSVLLCESPTGTGKSGIPAVVSHFRPGTTVLLGTTDLQDQYALTLPRFRSLWGTGRPPNYCIHPKHIAGFKAVYGTKPFRSECMFRKPTDCPYIDACPYQVAKIACMEAQARVLNFHYANFARWWREMVDDLFIDECHRLPVVLSSLVAVEMRDKHRAWLGLPAFPFAVGGAPVMLKRAMQWADRCAQALLPMTKVKDIKKQRSAKYQRAQLEMLAATLNEMFVVQYDKFSGSARYRTSAEWYVESRPGEKFFARPVVPGPYSSQLLEPRARSQVLMSATIGGEKGAEVLARELAIDEYEFVTYPHIFPKENRPVLFYTKAPKLSYRSPDGDYDRQIKMMVEVLRAHDGEKGIVHTASWKHAERIAKGLRREGYQGNVMIPRGDRVQSIRDFKQMKGSVAVVSPSWKEGLDFADDLCRWTIIAKIPFLSFADPVVKLRAKRPGGRGWIDWNAALAVVQAAGRGVRSETDYATTYILDGNWTRVARMAPHWFEWEKV